MKQIADNAGSNGAVVVQRVIEEKLNIGFDADKLEYVDMFKAGIIDPTKVVRSALENASSVAALLLTTEAVIGEIPDKKDKMPGMPQGGGYGGGEDMY